MVTRRARLVVCAACVGLGGCSRENPLFDEVSTSSDPTSVGGSAGSVGSGDSATVPSSTSATSAGSGEGTATGQVSGESADGSETNGSETGMPGDCVPVPEDSILSMTDSDTFLVGFNEGGVTSASNYGAVEAFTLVGDRVEGRSMLLARFEIPEVANAYSAVSFGVTLDVSAPIGLATLRVWGIDDSCNWIEGDGMGAPMVAFDGWATLDHCRAMTDMWPGGNIDAAKGPLLASNPLMHEVMSDFSLSIPLDPSEVSAWLAAGHRSILVEVEGVPPGVLTAYARESATDDGARLLLVPCAP